MCIYKNEPLTVPSKYFTWARTLTIKFAFHSLAQSNKNNNKKLTIKINNGRIYKKRDKIRNINEMFQRSCA